MINVGPNFQDEYPTFREEMGRDVDRINVNIAKVNDTLKNSPLENLNVESITWLGFLCGFKKAQELKGIVNGLRVLCEQNKIEVPEDHDLIQLGRKRK